MNSDLRRAFSNLFISREFLSKNTNNTQVLLPYYKIINGKEYAIVPISIYSSPIVGTDQSINSPHALFLIDINNYSFTSEAIQTGTSKSITKVVPNLVNQSIKAYPELALPPYQATFKDFYLDLKNLGLSNYVDSICLLIENRYSNEKKRETLIKALLRFYVKLPSDLYGFYNQEETDFITFLKL